MAPEEFEPFARVKDLFIEPWAIPIWPKNWGALSLFTNDQVNPAACLESQSNSGKLLATSIDLKKAYWAKINPGGLPTSQSTQDKLLNALIDSKKENFQGNSFG